MSQDVVMDELYTFTYGALMGVATKADDKKLYAFVSELEPTVRADQHTIRQLAMNYLQGGWEATIDAFYAYKAGRVDTPAPPMINF